MKLQSDIKNCLYYNAFSFLYHRRNEQNKKIIHKSKLYSFLQKNSKIMCDSNTIYYVEGKNLLREYDNYLCFRIQLCGK